MAQRLWSEAEVANAAVAPSSQNLHPAGTRLAWLFTPAGKESAKLVATGGCLRSSDAVRTAAKFLSLDISSAFLFTLHGKTQIGDEGDDGLLADLVGGETDRDFAFRVG